MNTIKSTGELLRFLGIPSTLQDQKGHFNVKVGFSEPRSDDRSPAGSESNAKIASVLEYGKSGQPPKPFLKPALSASKKAAIEAMKAKLESEVEDL